MAKINLRGISNRSLVRLLNLASADQELGQAFQMAKALKGVSPRRYTVTLDFPTGNTPSKELWDKIVVLLRQERVGAKDPL